MTHRENLRKALGPFCLGVGAIVLLISGWGFASRLRLVREGVEVEGRVVAGELPFGAAGFAGVRQESRSDIAALSAALAAGASESEDQLLGASRR